MSGPLARDAKASILVPTLVQTSKDVLSYWASMTCLFDPNHVPSDDKVTLPIAFFHIKSIRETHHNESSKHRVIVYEPAQKKTAAELSSGLREGAVQAVVDNMVRDPKSYNIEAVVPFQPVGRYITDGVQTALSTIENFIQLIGGDDTKAADTFASATATGAAIAKLMSAAADSLGKLPSMDGVSYINMNSLEAMADSCRPLCMKMWTGFQYEYVKIVDMEKSKSPLEDDVFRVNMKLEVDPVLSLTKPSDSPVAKISRTITSSIVSTTQKVLVAPVKAALFAGVDLGE